MLSFTLYPVHPRARGEHLDSSEHGGQESGSSPRSRGTLRGGLAATALARFIPALAGNTAAWG